MKKGVLNMRKIEELIKDITTNEYIGELYDGIDLIYRNKKWFDDYKIKSSGMGGGDETEFISDYCIIESYLDEGRVYEIGIYLLEGRNISKEEEEKEILQVLYDIIEYCWRTWEITDDELEGIQRKLAEKYGIEDYSNSIDRIHKRKTAILQG
jgi:hypothetical protein